MSEQVAPAQAQSTPTDTSVEAATQDSGENSAEELSTLTSESGDQSGESTEAQAAEQDVTDAQANLKAAKTASEKAQAKKELEKAKHIYKIKVDGVEEEWSGTEEDVKREIQLAKKARKEIQASSEMKKEIGEFLAALKADPRKVLADPALNVDMLEMAKAIINEQIENDLKSPEQLEREKLEKELEQLRRERKDEDSARQQAEYQRLVKHHETEIEERMMEALDTSGLPASPYILKRAADVMLSALQTGKDISPKQAVNIVKREMNKDIKDMFSASPEDLLEELLGSENLKRLNKRKLEKIKKPIITANQIRDNGGSPKKEERQGLAPKRMTINDWLKNK